MNKITGQVIKKYRLERNLTQEYIVKKTNISKAFISDIERGVKLPSLKTLMKIACALDMNAYEIVKEIELSLPCEEMY